MVLFEAGYHDLDGGDSLLQSGFWARFKEAHGWKGYPLSYTLNGERKTLLVLSRRIAGLFSIGYVPHGPELPADDDFKWNLAAMAREIQGYLPLGALFVRFDLPEAGSPLSRPFKKASDDIQPPDTVILDLVQDEETLLSGMHKKTRYNIKLAEKKGVTVRRGTPEEIDAWYEIYRITADRDKIAPHSREYYKRIFSLSKEYGPGSPEWILYLAEHEGELLAGNIVCRCGKTATYVYGATSNSKRDLMPAYLLQWTAIQEAKAADCTRYDFHGIPPADDPRHPMHGLYRFKTGFGGIILHRMGSWDFPYTRLVYPLYRLVERLRFFWYRVVKKRLG
jgi:lipid II:glycine glycyltransferase (peptidoglycan interpeptide bridge formation enzyme)